ncbi:hypothetical protein GZL_p00071 (plasmid) [Streptomyces sp. 769]|nr:hypothetical protein GZL_p00071 [Streptomyces sp. 769]
MTARTPGVETQPTLYARARIAGDPVARIKAFDTMATGEWGLMPDQWQETERGSAPTPSAPAPGHGTGT